ncbi:MAG TPA: hypothetical protein ENK64_00015, partial [Flavobacteriales bacterium]|nr:hypothetical protein [Flavobacteriales bacterium]
MKYIPLKLLFFLFVTNTLVAQIVNKGDIKISWGTNVYISGLDIINDNSGHLWSNNGTVIFKGDNFTNDGDMDANATGTTEFSGANEQYINGSNTAYFHNLVVNNTNNSVIQQTFVDADNLRVNDGAKDFDYKVVNDKSLTVNDVVTSNGDIRMIGTAQLIQTHPGASSNSGSKYLWIDQSGTTNQYWYNYWSAPVNQSGLWKIIYLRDGAEGDDNNISKYPLIQTIVSSAPSNDLPTQISHPVTLNAYWIFGFKNGLDGDYQTWFDNHLQDTGTVTPGEGYTMKGPGVDANLNNGNGNNTTTYKNWTFAGTPNDGDYSLSITAGNDYLVGNPYPSSLDADQFIKDNINSANGGNNSIDVFNGTLYFWEHTDGNDHYKDHYDGGYASYNLTGGTPSTSWKSGNTVGAKTPDRYIPVGQGFFVWSETTNDGGNITFNNAQRIFKTTPNTLIRPVSLT